MSMEGLRIPEREIHHEIHVSVITRTPDHQIIAPITILVFNLFPTSPLKEADYSWIQKTVFEDTSRLQELRTLVFWGDAIAKRKT